MDTPLLICNNQQFLRFLLLLVQLAVFAVGPAHGIDLGKKKAREAAINKIPLHRITPQARTRINQIVSRPTMFRSLPTQAMDCDGDMFLFLVRHPEVLVGIWEVMDITQVKMKRTGPFTLTATDGQGTTCLIELVYGDSKTHLFVARGKYDGPMVAKPITGSGVFVLHSSYVSNRSDRLTIGGQMDIFLQLDSIGADLVVRTLGPLIGRSADHNFVETAKFISQVSQASEVNPDGVKRLGMRIPTVNDDVRQRFIHTAMAVADRTDEVMANTAPRQSPQRSQFDRLLSPSQSTSTIVSSRRGAASIASRSNPVVPLKRGMNLRR